MQVIIKLEKEDITTRPFGTNIAIDQGDGPTIIFSQEAAIEFASDVSAVLSVIKRAEADAANNDDYNRLLTEYMEEATNLP